MPQSPEPGKWTKFGPALDCFVRGQCIHGIYGTVLGRASSELEVKLEATLDGSVADVAYLSEAHWHEVRGVLALGTKSFVQNVDSQDKLVRVAICLEPSRHLTAVFFRFSRRVMEKKIAKDTNKTDDAYPALSTIANPVTSPVLRVLQYYSSFLSDKSTSRMIVIYRRAGCSSMEELMEKRKDVVAHVRSISLAISSWVDRRHWTPLQKGPWLLSSTLCTMLNNL